MNNGKLYRLLTSFSPEEGKAAQEWLKSQARWRNSPVTKLLGHLLAGSGRKEGDWPSKVAVFAQCYPKRTYSEAYLRKQQHRLYQLLKTWLVEQSTTLEAKGDLNFLTILQERELNHDFQLLSKQIEYRLKNSSRRDESYFLECHQFYHEKDRFFGRQQERRYDDALQLKSASLDRYFILQKLRLACEMNNRNRIIQADYRADLLTEVLQLIDTERLDVEEPAIAIYRHVWLCLQQEGQVADFERLTELLRKHPQVFAHSELREIYRYAQNFCINKINSGEANFRNHLLHLYRYQLEAGLYLIDGSFPANDFKNIVTLGLSVKAYEWVKSFMQDYHIHLLPQQHDNVYNYNLAQYYFVTKAYDKAVGLLRSVKFTDRYYDINSSIILLKTYLALEDYDSFHYLLDAYKIRMQRNREVATGYRKSIVNFLRLCKQVGRMKERKDYLNASEYKTRQVKLKEQIEATQPLFDRKWLLNTLNPRIS